MASDRETLSGYSVRTVGAPYTLEHRVYIEKDGTPVSPFHDIPLYANDDHTILNMIVEIPRWTNAKMEVCYLSASLPSLLNDETTHKRTVWTNHSPIAD